MNSGDLLTRLRKKGPSDFVNTLLFDDNAWYFPTKSGDEYAEVKTRFGNVFGVQPQDVAVVGSAKYGFSLAPDKGFRAFQPDDTRPHPSDIDLVVISRALFNSTWHHLRRAHYNGAIDARKFFQEDVFRRFVMIGTDDAHETKYLRDLWELLDRLRKIATSNLGITQRIKVRVYCSWTDAKAYHIWSMQRLGANHGIQ